MERWSIAAMERWSDGALDWLKLIRDCLSHDSVGKIRAVPHAKAQRRKGPLPQQVTPAVGFACARQKTHGAACQRFAVGFVVFFDEVEKTTNPTEWGV
jgi:hypothetical protein